MKRLHMGCFHGIDYGSRGLHTMFQNPKFKNLKTGSYQFPPTIKAGRSFYRIYSGRIPSKFVTSISILSEQDQDGRSFPNGTISVMEIYKAREAADGTPLKGPDGKFVKGELVKIGVMGKGAGWGESAPPELRNGDWIYSMYMADAKTKAPDDTATCRACHLPLKDKDYIFRYDEYFQKRASY